MNARMAIDRTLRALIAVMAGLTIALGSLNILPALVGFKSYAVMSPSMAPQIPLGSLVFVDERTEGCMIAPDDVVAFKRGEADESVCVHRAKSINQEGGLIETKGDANDAPDLRLVPFEDVVGKVCAHIPLAGFALKWLESYRMAFLGTAAALILASASLSLTSPARKRTSQKGTECPNRPQQRTEQA